MRLPKPRGRLGVEVFDRLVEMPRQLPADEEVRAADPEDAASVLWVLHELSYRGFEDVADDAASDPESDPEVARVRRVLERDLEARLRSRWDAERRSRAEMGVEPGAADDVVAVLIELIETHEGPSMARFVQSRADAEQARELLRMRSIYHLKEADPTAWLVPRLPTRAKAALAEIQYDEYGGGRPERLHHALFASGLEGAGLRSEYGAYLDEAPLEVLEQNNAVSLFGMRRRLRGAAAGHFAAFEATSSVPSRRLAQGLARLGLGEAIVGYYREHVEADSVHDQLALRFVCAALVEEQPELRDDVLFGAFTCLDLEARFAAAQFDRWGVEGA